MHDDLYDQENCCWLKVENDILAMGMEDVAQKN